MAFLIAIIVLLKPPEFKIANFESTPSHRVYRPRTSENKQNGQRSLTQKQRPAVLSGQHPSQKILKEAEEGDENQAELQSRCGSR